MHNHELAPEPRKEAQVQPDKLIAEVRESETVNTNGPMSRMHEVGTFKGLTALDEESGQCSPGKFKVIMGHLENCAKVFNPGDWANVSKRLEAYASIQKDPNAEAGLRRLSQKVLAS